MQLPRKTRRNRATEGPPDHQRETAEEPSPPRLATTMTMTKGATKAMALWRMMSTEQRLLRKSFVSVPGRRPQDNSAWLRPTTRAAVSSSRRSLDGVEPIAKVAQARDYVAATSLAQDCSRRILHLTSFHQGPVKSVSDTAITNTERPRLLQTSSMKAVTTLSRGNFVAKFPTPSGLAIKLRNRMRSSGTPRAFNTSTAMMAEPPIRATLSAVQPCSLTTPSSPRPSGPSPEP